MRRADRRRATRGSCPPGSASSPATSRSRAPLRSASSWSSTARAPGLDQEHVGRPVHAHAVHPLPAAGHRLHRHGRGDLEGADEHQPGPADGQGPRRVHEQPDERDLGPADRLRQHAAGPVPERGADAGADAGLPPLGGPAGAGRSLGRRARPATVRGRRGVRLASGSTGAARAAQLDRVRERSLPAVARKVRGDGRPAARLARRTSSAGPRRSAGSAPTSRRSAGVGESLRRGVASPRPDRDGPDRRRTPPTEQLDEIKRGHRPQLPGDRDPVQLAGPRLRALQPRQRRSSSPAR